MGDEDDLTRWLMFGQAELQGPCWPSWMLHAMCVSADPDVFFPERGVVPDEARRICAVCPVQQECLAFAMDAERGVLKSHRSGVWGGLSPAERHELERTAVPAAA